eukprot:gene17334-35756_t
MSVTATLSSKFQISIPKAVRDELHWEAGQEFVFIPKDKGVLVMPVPELKELAGIAKGPLLMATPLRVVDTSAWIEWLIASPVGKRLAKEIPDKVPCAAPSRAQRALPHRQRREL